MAAYMPPKSPGAAEDKEHLRLMRDLRQQGQTALTWGLPNPASEASVLGMGLLMRDRLAEGTDSARAAGAAELAATMLDRTLQKMPQAGSVQCAKGCNFCCHSAVSVSAPELFRVVRLIGADGAPAGLSRAATQARAKVRTGAAMVGVLMGRPACPLLIEGDCSVYADRPLGCRQFLSTSVEGCRTAYATGKGELPFIPAAANVGLIVRALLLGAVASVGLKAQTYELSSALAVVLAEPDAERRWLAGEDVLADVPPMQQPPNMQNSVQRWSGMLDGLFE